MNTDLRTKIREAVERWNTGSPGMTNGDQTLLGKCADELIAILDAEGDDVAVGEWRDPSTAPVSTPMEQVYFLARCPNDNWSPGGHVHFACSYGDAGRCRPVGTNGARPFNGWMPVPSTEDRPARSGGVSDADVEDAARYRWLKKQHDGNEDGWHVRTSYSDVPDDLDQAIDAARKGERHE